MKTKLIFGSFLALSITAHSQNTFPSSGNAGIGTTSPQDRLHVMSSFNGNVNGGIIIEQTSNSSGNASLKLVNSGTGGHRYDLCSTGQANGAAGNFSIYDYTSASDRFFIAGATGNIGIGTTAPVSKLHIEETDANMSNNSSPTSSYYFEPSYSASRFNFSGATKIGAHSALHAYNLNNTPASSFPGGGYNYITGIALFGKSERTVAGSNANTFNIGVYGRALGAQFNIGGVFWGGSQALIAQKSESGGVENESPTCFGVWANATGKNSTAGFFNGKTYANEYFQNSDPKLQSNIKGLSESLKKIAALKANSFNYNPDEGQSMNLPEGEHLGLDPESVEKVFPTLVKEIKNLEIPSDREIKSVKTFKAINYVNLIPLLVSGVQEQQNEIDEQKSNIALLHIQLEEQKKLIAELNNKVATSTGINSISNIEAGFQMSQNEPNPFTHETVVKYTLPQTVTNAFMAVYDLTGKQITTFPIDQKGASFITITSEKLSPGIYIYSIVADGKVMDSKRMIVADK